MVRARSIALSLAFAPVGCVFVAPGGSETLTSTPGYEEAPAEDAGAKLQPFVGIEVEESIAGSLDSLEFLGGLRVASVAAGSPAEAAGIRVGDRILRASRAGGAGATSDPAAGAVDLVRVDQWSALLSSLGDSSAGSTGGASGDELKLSVERDGGLVDVTLRAVSRGAGGRVAARRFIERQKVRCVVETELVDVEGRTRSAARIVELAPASPLAEVQLGPGDRLLAIDSEELAGAADFARRVSALPYGADIHVEVLGRGRVAVELWEPERHVTAVELWPLFEWTEAADDSRSSFELLDLWIIWLYKRERDGETTKSSILRFISWESGVGSLTEEPGS